MFYVVLVMLLLINFILNELEVQDRIYVYPQSQLVSLFGKSYLTNIPYYIYIDLLHTYEKLLPPAGYYIVSNEAYKIGRMMQ